MLSLRLAYRNLIGAGLRTWLNVAVLSLVYVLIIWHQGLFSGMLHQISTEMIKDEVGGGQYWQKNYDPYDSFSFDESHSSVPDELKTLIQNGNAASILIRQAAIYPEGRIQSVILKGIDPGQRILEIPTAALKKEENMLPVLIGRRMAESNSLKIGDQLMIRWRDVNGTFDAVEGRIVEIMNTKVPTIDSGQLWVPLKRLRKMTNLDDEATLIIIDRDLSGHSDIPGWEFKSHDFLLKDVHEMVKTKRVSSLIMYLILLFLAMLAIFDTQVLAIFKRRKEIGTLMALGMTRLRVISVFTLEGALNGILALGVGAIYGTPLIILTAKKGLTLPQATQDYGYAMANKLFPVYSLGLVLTTVVLVMVTVTVVSYLPSRKISRLNPTEALKGKLS
ncbi:MAG: ABC transporter permease [bacterium]